MHYRKVTMQMLINHVQYKAGLLYKYWKFHLMIYIFLLWKNCSFGKFSHIVTLAKYFHRCQCWSVCIKFTLYPVDAYLTTEIQINDMRYNVNQCKQQILPFLNWETVHHQLSLSVTILYVLYINVREKQSKVKQNIVI